MSAFEYVGYNRAGRRCRGILDGRDAKEIREILAAQGVLADQVREVKAGYKASVKRGTVAQRIGFYEELGALLGAGIPMVDALGIIFSAPGVGIEQRMVAQVRDAIREGKPLASSLATVFGGMQPFEKAVLEAGQRAAALPLMLERLAGFLEAQHNLADKVRSAMIYPMFVVGFAAAMMLGITGIGLPAVGRMLGETGVSLPFMIRWSMQWGATTAALTVAGLVALTVTLRGSLVRAGRSRSKRQRLERLILKLPLLGAGYTVLINLRFVRTLELLATGGHPMVESLALAGTASGSVWVEEIMKQAAEKVRHGGCTPAEAVAMAPPLAETALPAWIRSGEASGATGKMLGRLGERLEQRWERFANRALNLVLPAVILVVGVFVLAATLSILLPILHLNRILLQ